MGMIEERTGMEILDEAGCLAVLRSTQVGRVGVIDGAVPVILPVNFVVDGRSILFRSADGGKLSAVANGEVISFEVDVIDMGNHTGTSVLLSGKAEVVTDPDELKRVIRLGLHPWATTPKPHVIRIPFERMSGRRIAPTAHGELFLG